MIGYAVGSDVMQSTNPYYRSTYVLVTRKGGPLAAVQGLDDPRLKGHAIGVFSATPPVDIMLAKGLMEKAIVYPILVDHRFDSPLPKMMGDIKSGKIDAAIVWGPLVGLDVKSSGGELVMSPLLADADKPGFSYRISFGIRHDEPDWKHKLEAVERIRAVEIDQVLVDFNVPLVDDAGRLIPPERAATGAATAATSSEPAAGKHGRAAKVAPSGLQDARTGRNRCRAERHGPPLISGSNGSRLPPAPGVGRRSCR